jgi:hypothetical protein
MNKVMRLFSTIAILMLMGTLASCDKNFDEPPGPQDQPIAPNMTIAAFKAMHTTPGNFTDINQDIIISGIVVANDKSGNFYKQLFIQDTTGAIQLSLDATNLYTSYPVGRRIYVRAKGLTLSDNNGTMILGVKALINGANSLEGIPSGFISRYIIGGSINNPVSPLEVTFADLTTNMQNRYINALIKLKDYEFVVADTGRTYSDTSAYRNNTNLNIKGCDNSTLIVRTSGYANFAGINVPNGSGDITSIYTVFGSTRQLVIRDTSDVQFSNPRCGSAPPTGAIFWENFEGVSTNNPVALSGWTNIAEAGTKVYLGKTFSSNLYAEMSAFSSGENSNIAWLITPGVNLDGTTNEKLSFDTKQGYTGTGNVNAAPLKILVSTNYTGTGNPWAAGVTWTDITSQATLSPGAATSYPTNYTNSGDIDLSSYSGTIYVAFKYEGGDPTGTANDKTSNWQIDNVKITGN